MDAAETGIGGGTPGGLREQIHVTQNDLGEKIHALEHEVDKMAHHAADTVRERIESVRERIDLAARVRERPLAWGIAALGLGALVGSRLRVRRGSREPGAPRLVVARRLIIPNLRSISPSLVLDGLSLVTKLIRGRRVGAPNE
jgi:hypothetical protein